MKKKKMGAETENRRIVGSTVMGARGQVVIPKEIRERLGLQPGMTLMAMQHERGAIVLFPVEHLRAFMDQMNKQIASVLPKK